MMMPVCIANQAPAIPASFNISVTEKIGTPTTTMTKTIARHGESVVDDSTQTLQNLDD